jgi:hypothetical protein
MDRTADKWKKVSLKHNLQGDHFMANDQMKVFCKTVDVDWIQDTSLLTKER